ncbi:CRISPR-associated protein Cas5 [Planctomycetes bacterium Pan216]|uniref:pre-crRNA processing endonuclease n=1 Tax=Kolteria novifilia TaxID=2527975 RepID=A0A518B649_9BACT|nr:CRISPR-associated protein Cas5 [Planctomycetes bacterium Pan216]
MPDFVSVSVWGEYACFTRPELKVERMSYPVMTPSAARGVLDAILWRPQMRWHVRRIAILKPFADYGGPPYQLANIRRNEIQDKVPARSVSAWMKDSDSVTPYFVDSAGRAGVQGENRTQRNTLLLRDVRYRIDATPILTGLANKPRQRPPNEDEEPGADSVAKYVSMFNRRVSKGQCFHRPYLGCREFAADFAPPSDEEQPVEWTEDLGPKLYDVRHLDDGRRVPGFFLARVNDGVLHCDTRAKGPNGEPPVRVMGWSDEEIEGAAS